jgi:hypothetical protein
MDGNLFTYNKSIKDDKIDYVVMGTERLWMVRVFSGTHTGNVLTDVDVPIPVFQSMQNTRKRKPYYDTL